MAVVWPSKNNFADGDVLTATNMNNIADTLNVFDPTSATNGQVWTANGSGGGSFAAPASGYVLVKPTSVSAVSGTATINSSGSVTLTSASQIKINGIFTSTYENYFMVYTFSSSNAGNYSWRFTAATVETTSGYKYLTMKANASAWTVATTTGASVGHLAEVDTAAITTSYGLFFRPQMTNEKITRIWSQTGASNGTVYDIMNNNTNTTAFDGISFTSSGFTAAGLVAFYGLAK